MLGLSAADAATWRVRPGEAIQAVIAQAAAGDVVEVERGFYDESLRIDKPLTLRGLNRPTISGGQRGDTLRVAATDVTIEGLIVRDSGHELKAQHAGIYIQPGSHRAVVRRCDLVYNLFGLWIEKANDVRIEHNLITYGKAGRMRRMGRRPKVRGSAMNPVAHPMGGGEGRRAGGRHPVSPWGVLAKGGKTRHKRKTTSRRIIRGRKRGRFQR